VSLLDERKVRYVTFAEWKKIDSREVELGKPKGKPREKFTYVREMLEIIN
jgi:NADPH-dependent glutamate synthase beta subunit-like oxidoreductase